MKKRVLSILLVFSMILAMFPVNAMAADNRFAEKVRDEDIIEYIYINDVELPKAGEKPDFDVTIPEDAGYSLYTIENPYSQNGIIWAKKLDQLSSEIVNPETDVFEAGETYSINIALKANDGFQFYLNEYDAYGVEAYIDGRTAEVAMYDEDMRHSMTIAVEYTIPEIYDITVEGGNAYNPKTSDEGIVEDDGEPICSAAPGVYVKVVADEPEEGWKFSFWELLEGDMDISNAGFWRETMWFEMPASDVKLRAVFEHLEHEHDYYEYNEEVHWSICTGGEKIPNSEEAHDLDEDGTCICGVQIFSVMFHFGDSPIAEQQVMKGETVVEPEEPAWEGVVFVGWYTEDGKKYDFSEPVYKDINLTAKFVDEDELHTVAFCFGDSPVAWQQVIDGETAIEPDDPAQEGVVFVGWYTEDGKLYDFSQPVTSDIKLIAKFEEEISLFEDIKKGAWYTDAVKFVFERGLITGTSKTTFEPNAPMTRGMLVTVLYRYEGRPEVTTNITFSDVASSKYYAKAISWASDQNIVSGYKDGNFGPNDSITREQIAKVLYRYAEYKGYDVTASQSLSSFKDADAISSYAVKYMKWATAEGLIKGSNGMLNPKGDATRAEISAILKRFVEKYEVQ